MFLKYCDKFLLDVINISNPFFSCFGRRGVKFFACYSNILNLFNKVKNFPFSTNYLRDLLRLGVHIKMMKKRPTILYGFQKCAFILLAKSFFWT